MTSQQRTIKLEIRNLKNLKRLIDDNAIALASDGLTAIMGANCCGKSTVLHALACCYKPLPSQSSSGYKFSDFFLPNTDSRWEGSDFSMHHSYRVREEESTGVMRYAKQSDRWAPKYDRRPERYVSFVGVKSCVPKIEDEKLKTFFGYETVELSDEVSQRVIASLSNILNRNYERYTRHSSRRRADFVGVRCGGIQYSALSMGAGEQRLAQILSEVHRAPKYALILIDEIDLLLHTDALVKLLQDLASVAQRKNLQIVFTTHREAILSRGIDMVVRHIHQSTDKTFCFNETKPDAIQRLTGVAIRPLEIFVEDDLAKAIVRKVAAVLGMQKLVAIREYGSASNCFTVAAGLALQGANLENMLFVLDGDVYRSAEERTDRINKALSGDTPRYLRLREQISERIICFNLPADTSPEAHIHQMLRAETSSGDPELDEIVLVANGIVSVQDRHDYLNMIFEQLGVERAVGITQTIDIVRKSIQWPDYISKISDWLTDRRTILLENTNGAV